MDAAQLSADYDVFLAALSMDDGEDVDFERLHVVPRTAEF